MEEAVSRALYAHRWMSPLGGILLAGDGEALTGLWFEGQKHFPVQLLQRCEERSLPVFGEVQRWLDAYFSGMKPGFTPPLHLHGTDFQREVWQQLLKIPYGQTSTYGQIAGALAQRRGIASMSAQAVGGAVGRNPISLIVPCHRVIGADGSLTGYAAGMARKRALLRLEGHDSLT